MSDKATLDRQQSKDFESVLNTRQDRGTLFTGGGEWTWDAAGGVLSWTDKIDIHVSSLGTHTVASGSQTGLAAAGEGLKLTLDRSTAGSMSIDKQVIESATFDVDDAMCIGVRGTDDRFYMRDGTVFSHGETKKLGTTQALVDRAPTDSYARVEFVTGHQVDQGTGDVITPGNNFYRSGATFLTSIPNTSNDPDTPTYIRIDTDGVYEVISVVDDENLTLGTPATVATGLTFEVYDSVFGYLVGSGQLMVIHTDTSTDSEVFIPVIDYTEVGAPSSISRKITFVAPAPSSGTLQFINLTGGMGPSGDTGTVSLQDIYDVSHDATVDSGDPIRLRAPAGPDPVLEVHVGASPPQA